MSENNGRKIRRVIFANSPPNVDPALSSTPEEWLQWHEDYHGNHDVAWVVQISDGKEIARFNPRYIESIFWSTP